jgi:hypothetical protein
VQTTVGELLRRAGVDAAGTSQPGARQPGVTAEELPHNRWLSAGVWRVRLGTGQLAVLKHASSERPRDATPAEAHWSAGNEDPRRWTYWCREPLAYEHDLASAYAGSGIVVPSCLGRYVDDRESVLVLEWAVGEPGETWPAVSYAPAAEALGRAQAPFLLDRPAPAFPWLSRRFLRQYSTEKPVDWDLLDDDAAWSHPLVREVFPARVREGVQFVHAHRERLYQISESLPRTLCHLDFWPKNLLRRPGGEIVLLDWAFAGEGAIGEDAGNLVPDAVFDHFIAADQMPFLEETIVTGYLRGLRAAGWDDDPRLVQLGMWSSAVKYDWLAAQTLSRLSQERHFRYGGEGEVDATHRFRERSRALLFNSQWARQAIDLAAKLGL